MPVEYTVGREPLELRCPKCNTFVGHSQKPMEAPICAECARLAPIEARLATIEARLAEIEVVTTGRVQR